MKIYAKYISFLYIKYVSILLVALECFYVGVDVLTNLKDFPTSANLALLYVIYTALVALNYTLPLSLIFALIITFFTMIRSNEFICLCSLGISKNSLLLPPFFIALIISTCFVGFNATPFAYALDFQKSIQNLTTLSDQTTKQMLLKYENKIVFMNELNAISKAASNIRILTLENGEISSYARAKNAIYNDKKWTFNDLNLTKFPKVLSLDAAGFKSEISKKRDDLFGFEPTSLQKVYNASNSYSIIDALAAIKVFKSQNIDISNIKAALYNMIFSPYFAPLMMLILYTFMPYSGRFVSLALLSFGFFMATLLVWGVLFVLNRFSLNGFLIPEFGIILPIALIFSYGFFLFSKNARG